jgi:hypothetical protein
VTINGGSEQDMSVFRDAEQAKGSRTLAPRRSCLCGYRSPHQCIAAFGRTSQASSASFFSQALIPLSPAFLRYEAFSAAVQRKCTCLEALSLASFFGAPLRLTFKPHDWRYASDAPGRQYGDQCVRCETCGLKAIAPLTPVRPAP